MKPRDLFFVFACVSVISMILIDHAGIFSYWGRSALKIMMFGIIPAMIISKTHTWTTIFSKGRYLKHVLLLGALIFLVVLAGYWLLDGIIAFDQVPDALAQNVGVTLDNFLWVFIYIVLINGPLEEFFFRYFMLNRPYDIHPMIMAWISSFLFAIYHVGMLFSMFHFSVFLLAIAGLMIVGLFFIWINQKSKGILYSVLLHMFANGAINLVGWIILLQHQGSL